MLLGSVWSTARLSANFGVVNDFSFIPSGTSNDSMIKLRHTRQAMALVSATVGLERSSWRVGVRLVCEPCESRTMFIELVILCRQISVERLDIYRNNTGPYP